MPAGSRRRGFRRPPGGGPFDTRAGGPRSADDFSFGDIFSDLFGSMRGRGEPGSPFGVRGRDARYSLEVDFLEAATGAKKRVTLPDSGALDITVPQGVVDGQTLRLKGRGAPGRRGAEPGDALVEIRVRPHPHFKRVDDDIVLDLPITLDEAVLGAKIEVPTISGRVQLTLPKATSSGRIFRLKGKGVHNVTTAIPATSSSPCASCFPMRSTMAWPTSSPSGARSTSTTPAAPKPFPPYLEAGSTGMGTTSPPATLSATSPRFSRCASAPNSS